VYAAVKFILYTMAGSVLMLVAIIALAWAYSEANGGTYSFNLLELQGLSLSETMERW
jgi:NADH-quinone oxidoreductase subunit M